MTLADRVRQAVGAVSSAPNLDALIRRMRTAVDNARFSLTVNGLTLLIAPVWIT